MDFKDTKLLFELVNEYNEILKKEYIHSGNCSNEDDFPYSEKHPHYFKQKKFDNIIRGMSKETYNEYSRGLGHELEPLGKDAPPKFISVASSALFCYTKLEVDKTSNKKEGADFFSIDDDRITDVEFEKKLVINENLINGKHPYMDAYAITNNREYFFECKCQEFFFEKDTKIAKSYFGLDKDLIVKYIPKEFLHENKTNYEIDEKLFGVENSLFNYKQLLTHLMGIVSNKKRDNSVFIYYYQFPSEKYVDDEDIKEVIFKAINDTIIVFESKIIKEYCKKHSIELQLWMTDKYDLKTASKNNTVRVF